MYTIRSTYAEWVPEFDDYPQGRTWPGSCANYRAAWTRLENHLLLARWKGRQFTGGTYHALAPYGHAEPTARYGDTTIFNDAETITLTEL